MADQDDPKELDLSQATAAIEQATKELSALREQIQSGIATAADIFATLFQRPVDPETLVSVLMTEVNQIVITWGAAQGNRPDEVEAYFDSLLRQMRRLFRAQLVQALKAAMEPQKRVTIQ